MATGTAGGSLLGIGYLQIQVAMSQYRSDMNSLERDFARRIAAMNTLARALRVRIDPWVAPSVAGRAGSAIGGAAAVGAGSAVAGAARGAAANALPTGFRGAGFGRAAAGFAVGAGLIKAIQEAAEFEQAMANVRAVTQASDADFAKLTEAARKMGRESVFAASEAAKALEEMGKLGMSAENSILALPGALQLAAAGELSIAEAAEIAGRNINVFGKNVRDLTEVNDILAATAIKSATDIKAVAVALSYAGPSAKAAGMSLEQTTAILAAMADAGIEGSRAGAALRNVIETLRTPNSRQRKILAEMGITPEAFKDARTGALDVLGFLEALQKAGGTNRAVEIFGKRGGTEIMSAMGLEGREGFGPGVEGMRDRERAIGSAKGLAAAMASIKTDTFTGQVKLMKNALGDLAIQLAGPMLKVLGLFVEATTAAANGLVALDKAFGGAVGWIIAGIGGLALLGIAVWGVVFAVKGLIAALTVLTAHPIVAVVTLLIGLFLALAGAIANADTAAANAGGFTGFTAKAKLAFLMLKQDWRLTLEWMVAFAKLKIVEIGNAFAMGARGWGELFKAAWDGLEEGEIENIGKKFMDGMGKALAEPTPLENKLRKELEDIEEKMRAGIAASDADAVAKAKQAMSANAAAAGQMNLNNAMAAAGDQDGALSDVDEYYDRILEGLNKAKGAGAGGVGAGAGGQGMGGAGQGMGGGGGAGGGAGQGAGVGGGGVNDFDDLEDLPPGSIPPIKKLEPGLPDDGGAQAEKPPKMSAREWAEKLKERAKARAGMTNAERVEADREMQRARQQLGQRAAQEPEKFVPPAKPASTADDGLFDAKAAERDFDRRMRQLMNPDMKKFAKPPAGAGGMNLGPMAGLPDAVRGLKDEEKKKNERLEKLVQDQTREIKELKKGIRITNLDEISTAARWG